MVARLCFRDAFLQCCVLYHSFIHILIKVRYFCKSQVCLWCSLDGIEVISITQFILRSLLCLSHSGTEQPVSNHFLPFLCLSSLQTSPALLPPLRNTCSYCAAFILKSSLFILTLKGINRYAVAKTKSTPMFDFSNHSPHEAQARCNQECLMEFNQSKSPQLLLKASSCLNVL